VDGVSEAPRVTIGVPVFNEDRFLDASLCSLRGQGFGDLEIVISDNASTDKTLEICERHAADDPRIRLEPLPSNVGAVGNFRRVVELARGEYFMWGTGHDLWTPGLVEECVGLLESDPDASVAFAGSRWIGADDDPLPRRTGWSDTQGLSPIARLFTVLWGDMHPLMGVMRTAWLRTCSMPEIVGWDLVVLSQLALRGTFRQATGSTWSRREFRTESNYDEKLRRYTSDDTGLARSKRTRIGPLLGLPGALMRVVLRSELSPVDKLLAMPALVAAMPVRYRVGAKQP
jgi:glycosyltransferase involved in cell wall biosynthesis